MSETTQTTQTTPPPAPATDPVPAAPAPVSFLARWRADVEAAAQAIGVDAEKLWALIKEHM